MARFFCHGFDVTKQVRLERIVRPATTNFTDYLPTNCMFEPTAKEEQGMSQSEPKIPPKRTEKHDALEVFLGDWRAKGWSFGQPDQRADDPKAAREEWTSTHTGKWHTGKFFLIQDERAMIGEGDPPPFDTISIMGVDPETQEYFARSFENHGFFRLYEGKRDGNIWTFVGATERLGIEFSDDAKTQTVTWEWLKDGQWLPLCDRVATRSS